MPVDYQILRNQNVTYVRYSGQVDGEQVIAALKRYLVDPLFGPGLNLLVDLRAVSVLDMSYRTLLDILGQTILLSGEGLTKVEKVFLAPSDQAFGLSSLYQRIANDQAAAGGGRVARSLHVTRDESEALKRLSRPEASIAELLVRATSTRTPDPAPDHG